MSLVAGHVTNLIQVARYRKVIPREMPRIAKAAAGGIAITAVVPNMPTIKVVMASNTSKPKSLKRMQGVSLYSRVLQQQWESSKQGIVIFRPFSKNILY